MRSTLLWLLSGALLVVSCGGPPPPANPDDVARLPAYTAESGALLGGAFSLGLQRNLSATERVPPPDADAVERAAASEGVVPVAIVTVSSDVSSGGELPLIQLALKQRAAPLRGSGLTPGTSVLDVPPGTATYSRARASDAQLVGRHAILFFRRYNQDGQLKVAWYLDADTPALREMLKHK